MCAETFAQSARRSAWKPAHEAAGKRVRNPIERLGGVEDSDEAISKLRANRVGLYMACPIEAYLLKKAKKAAAIEQAREQQEHVRDLSDVQCETWIQPPQRKLHEGPSRPWYLGGVKEPKTAWAARFLAE